MKDDIGLKGKIHIVHYGDERVVKEERDIENLIVTTGKVATAKRINGTDSLNPFTYVEIGTGTATATAGDSALVTYYKEDAADCSYEASNKAKWISTFSFTESVSVTEAGIFNGAHSGGTMLARQVFAVLNVENGDSIEITWTVTVS
jgi:hypothetical protein